MSVADLLAPERISLLLTGVALVAIAVWIFILDVSNRALRVFALLLALRGLTFFLGPLRSTASTASESVLWANLAPYTIIPLVPLVAYFLFLYPRPRGLARWPGGGIAVLAGTIGLLAWYAANHASYAAVTFSIPAGYSSYGPLFVLQGLRLPAFALAGLLLANSYRKQPTGSAGFSQFLMVAGFTLNALFDGTLAAIDIANALRNNLDIGFPWNWARWWLPVLALPLGLATGALLLPVVRRARREPELQEVRRFVFFGAPLALASPFVSLLPYAQSAEHATFLMGVWRLLVPLLLTYALLRYSLFSIDLHVKVGVRRGILIGIFVFTFFVISEAAEAIVEQAGGDLVSQDLGPMFGVASAAGLAVLGKPIQRLADRAANGVMPDTQPIEKLGSQARFRLYRDQFQMVQQDGQVTPKERRMLSRLAAYLGIQEDEALDLELGETPARDEPAPPRPKRSASTVARSVVAVLGTAAVFGGVSAILEALANPSSFATGLVSAAFVALLLGPIESLSERLTRRRKLNPAKEQTMREALADAWADGNLSERDLAFLAALQKRLGVGKADRNRIEAEVLGKPARRKHRRQAAQVQS